MTVELTGRIPSKKNSRRHFVAGGRRIVAPSAAYERWHREQSLVLLSKRPTSPLAGPLSLTLHLFLKGRIDQDLDNAVASICDLFQDVGIITNDKQVAEMHLYKHSGNPDFFAAVELQALMA
jgi:Holliday junction resolvase RusA-like endonuclease